MGTNPTSTPEDASSIPGSSAAMSCGVGPRRGSNPALLWLWWRPAAAALIRPQPGNFHVPQGWPEKEKKKGKRKSNLWGLTCLYSKAELESESNF